MAVILAVVLAVHFGAAAEGATLASDKGDYAPGETVILSGVGFAAGETIDLSISIDDPASFLHITDYTWVRFTADAQGGFEATYVVPAEAQGMTLTATALGISSARIASATFTDGVVITVRVLSLLAEGNLVTLTLSVSALDNWGKPYYVESVRAIFRDTNAIEADEEMILTCPTGFEWSATLPMACQTKYYLSSVYVKIFSAVAEQRVTPEKKMAVETAECPPKPICPTNTAPGNNASNKDFGQVEGCLTGGSLEYTAPLENNYFWDMKPADPDGDPVTLTMSAESVTFVGPGNADVVVTLTVTDDPSARNLPGCEPLVPLSTSVEAHVTAQVIYKWLGFTKPLTEGVSTIVKLGSSVPVKFNLSDCSGTAISGPTGHYILVQEGQSAAPNGEPTVSDSGASNDNTSLFRYSGTADADGTWIYNLKTKLGSVEFTGSPMPGTTYTIWACLLDGTSHPINISLKK